MLPFRFHWSMSSAGEVGRGAVPRSAQSGRPNLDVLVHFCEHAERHSIESVLTAFGFHRADPIVLATAVGLLTERIKFMVAVRSGICSPTAFVQQVNSVAAITRGRICLNVVAGHTPEEQRGYGDFLDHDARYARTDEFLTICRTLWETRDPVTIRGEHYRVENARLNLPFLADGRTAPEIYVGGNSPQAAELAVKHASCLLRLPDAPEAMRPAVEAVTSHGTEVGLLVSLVIRDTKAEAVAAAEAMLERLGNRPRQTHRAFRERSDSVAFTSMLGRAEAAEDPWLSPHLWAGAVPFLGAPAVALVGSPEDIATALLDYREIGVTQFLFMGWPDLDEMTRFSRDVVPIVRAKEPASGAKGRAFTGDGSSGTA
jgi:alkanesulfonate monooxygenase